MNGRDRQRRSVFSLNVTGPRQRHIIYYGNPQISCRIHCCTRAQISIYVSRENTALYQRVHELWLDVMVEYPAILGCFNSLILYRPLKSCADPDSGE